MFHLVLFQPEIPPNTGNVIRLSANIGARLHLIRPLGFKLDDKQLRRAGLDYQEYASLSVHESLEAFLQDVHFGTLYACTTKAQQYHTEPQFKPNDAFLFGPETRGLPAEVLTRYQDSLIKIPMMPHNRSLNLSNAVAVIAYEAWRQCGFGKPSTLC